MDFIWVTLAAQVLHICPFVLSFFPQIDMVPWSMMTAISYEFPQTKNLKALYRVIWAIW